MTDTNERMTEEITKNGDEHSVCDTKHHIREPEMTEAERQFRMKGWTRTAPSEFRWESEKYGILHLDPSYREELMDAWLCGFVAGKEACDEW